MSNPYFLSHGKHETPEEGRCAMEWVAYLAGEPHTDQPVCVSPVLRGFGIRLNDILPDEDRQRLRPYLARCIGTAGDGRDPERLRILAEHVLRTSLPRNLDEAGCHEAAERIRQLPLDLTLEHVRATIRDVGTIAALARDQKRSELRAKVRKRWPADAAYATAYADDAYAAYAAAYADAAAAAAYAAYAPAATAYAYAAYAADAYAAAAYADDAAAAAAYAVYATYATAAAAPSTTYTAVYEKAKAAALDALKPRRERALCEALDLFDRMLPKEVVQLPVAEDAEAICALPAGVS